MITIYEKFLSTLTEEKMIQIISEYEQFEKDGFIGECLLREKVTQYESMLGYGTNYTTVNMINIATSCYRYFSNKYFDIFGIKKE